MNGEDRISSAFNSGQKRYSSLHPGDAHLAAISEVTQSRPKMILFGQEGQTGVRPTLPATGRRSHAGLPEAHQLTLPCAGQVLSEYARSRR